MWDAEAVDDLAQELRKVYMLEMSPWAKRAAYEWSNLTEKERNHWRAVAIEAHRWLVG